MILPLRRFAAGTVLALGFSSLALAADPPATEAKEKPRFDAALATQVGADEHGMRSYVLVILKTGPKPMPAGPDRDAMFRGHFANIQRLAAEGKLALAGPFGDDTGDWRGMFIFAVPEIEEAKKLVETDPVIRNGEMIPEFHKYYGSAALMLVNEAHGRIQQKSF
jgi:uncharacterized protein YciI